MDKEEIILLNELVLISTRLHCRLCALEELAVERGIPQAELDRRAEEHWLRRQIRTEDLIGPEGAARMFDEPEPPAGPTPPHAPPERE